MVDLALATIAFNRPRLVAEQIRLLTKNLDEAFSLTVVDNSSNTAAREAIEAHCASERVTYVRADVDDHDHAAALQFAWDTLLIPSDAAYLGVLDHDIFPARSTRLTPAIAEAGFFGVGQRHSPTGRFYLWPGFCFFSRAWLTGRQVEFGGIRGEDKADDGDTGSGMWGLFVGEDWAKMYRVDHGYKPIRQPDDHGLQSWGYETIGDWLHFSNGSHWMRIPAPEERDRALFALLEAL